MKMAHHAGADVLWMLRWKMFRLKLLLSLHVN